MPAVVLVGAQWGDEGKGKATDLLGDSCDYVVKFNGGNNAGHTIVIGSGDDRREVCVAPAPERNPHTDVYAGDRQRCRRRPRRAVPGDRRAGVPGPRHLQARHQCERARHHALQPHPRQGDRAVPRLPTDRDDRTRHRPDLRRQDVAYRHPHPGPLRREHPSSEGRGRPRHQEPGPREDLQPPGGPRRRRRRGAPLLRRASSADGPRHLAAAGGGARPRRHRAARGRPGDAAGRRLRDVPVRHVLQRDRRGSVHRVPGSRPPGSTRSSRSSRPTRHGSAKARSRPSCSTTTASTSARLARSTARRPGGRAAAAGWTP